MKTTTAKAGDIIESVITKGDLDQLSAQERTRYYVEVCKSVGLNPLTKPFEFIRLNGKLTLYALRNATDQLRTIHGVSVDEIRDRTVEGIIIVTTKVRNKEGRTDVATGAVAIANLRGDVLANAIMKAETKAKRRATLSICGLGFLDESELEAIPPAAIKQVAREGEPPPPSAETPAPSAMPTAIALPKADTQWRQYVKWGSEFIAKVHAAKTVGEIDAWQGICKVTLVDIQRDAPKIHERIEANVKAARGKLTATES